MSFDTKDYDKQKLLLDQDASTYPNTYEQNQIVAQDPSGGDHAKLDNKQDQQQLSDSQSQQSTNILDEKGEFDDALAKAEKDYQVYSYRYVIAGLYLIASLAISLQQNTYAPQSEALLMIYNIPGIEVTMTSLIHMILHAPVSIPANYIVEKYGVKTGIVIAAILCIIGSWIRCLVNIGDNTFYIVLFGQGMVGIANPFVINSLNKISATWFYPADRAAVTSLLSFFSTITGLMGLLMPGIWFAGYDAKDHSQENIQHGRDLNFSLTLTQAIMITAMMLPNVFFFREKPPTPSSFTSDVEREDFKVALQALVKNKDYLIQCVVFSVFYGSFTVLAVILSLILGAFGIVDPLYVAVLAVLPIVSGIGGSVLSSKYLKKTQKYKKALVICQIGSIISLTLFFCMLPTKQFGLLIPPVLLTGFFIVPLIPAMIEFSSETNFPIGEATTTGFLFALSHIFSGCLGIAMSTLVSQKTHRQLYSMISIGIIILMFVICLILFRFVKEDLKRLRAEKERKVDPNDYGKHEETQKIDSNKVESQFDETKSSYSSNTQQNH